MSEHFEIEPRPAAYGGGWRLRLLTLNPDGSKTELGGGVFTANPDQDISDDDAYADALEMGEDWLYGLPAESPAGEVQA